MKLVVAELISVVDQEITIGDDDLDVVAIRPHLIRFNNPAGSVRMQVLDSSKRLIAQSALASIATVDVDDAVVGEDFVHGYVRFYLNVPMKAGTTYWIRLVGSGYTFSESAYLGWCNDFDLRKVPVLYDQNGDWEAALDVELWVRRRSLRGVQG